MSVPSRRLILAFGPVYRAIESILRRTGDFQICALLSGKCQTAHDGGIREVLQGGSTAGVIVINIELMVMDQVPRRLDTSVTCDIFAKLRMNALVMQDQPSRRLFSGRMPIA